MFSLKRETDYAVQLIKYLSGKGGKKFKSLKDFSKESEISFWFLQKIARKLNLAGIIAAEQGVNGGYAMKVPLKGLTLYRIFEIMEGKQAVTPCLLGEIECAGNHKKCKFRTMTAKLNKEIIKTLQQVKISAV
ncbi:MAG: Rrf2 family transcriptional regulator [Patescibacteria group bacterium]